VDAIICPLAPFPAARPGKFTWYGYSVFVNLLDYTAVVLPATKVDQNVDKVDSSYDAPGGKADQETQDDCEFDRSVVIECLLTFIDDPEIYHGANVSVQLVGRRLQEEKMLALAEYVGQTLRG